MNRVMVIVLVYQIHLLAVVHDASFTGCVYRKLYGIYFSQIPQIRKIAEGGLKTVSANHRPRDVERSFKLPILGGGQLRPTRVRLIGRGPELLLRMGLL